MSADAPQSAPTQQLGAAPTSGARTKSGRVAPAAAPAPAPAQRSFAVPAVLAVALIAVVGGALYVSRRGDATSALLFAMLGAMLTAWAGGWSMYALRRLNGRWTKHALPALEAGNPHALSGLQMRGLFADLLRGFALTAVALALLLPLTEFAVANGHGDSARIRAVLVAVAVAVAGSAAWKLSHGSKHGPWLFFGGLAVGCAMLLST